MKYVSYKLRITGLATPDGTITVHALHRMRREGQFLKDRFLNGEWASTFQYAMLAEEFGDK